MKGHLNLVLIPLVFWQLQLLSTAFKIFYLRQNIKLGALCVVVVYLQYTSIFSFIIFIYGLFNKLLRLIILWEMIDVVWEEKLSE